MTIPLAKLTEAAPTKPEGWLQRVLKAGETRGSHLHIDRLTWLRLSAEFGQWGDAVAVAAKPIARAIDQASGKVGLQTNVEGCVGCAKRHIKLNGGSEAV